MAVAALFCLVTPLLYLTLARYQLPVCANVDERIALSVLSRFHTGTAIPMFFLYPTLYFYVTYLLTLPFGFAHLLEAGRLLNLGFVGLTAGFAYTFCIRHLNSRVAGAFCGLLVISSPLLVTSGSYLSTDALLGAMTLLSIDRLVVYFKRRDSQSWWMAQIVIGLAVGCKYTAFLLWVVYAVNELLSYRDRTEDERNKVVNRRLLAGVVFSIGLLLVALAIWFPTQTALHFATRNHSSVELKSAASYLAFFAKCRKVSALAGTFALVAGFLVYSVDLVYELVSPVRLYLGLLVTVGVTLLTTPYALLTPGKFLYDIGALMRGNVVIESGAASNSHAPHYLLWMFSNESALLIALAIGGLLLLALRQRRYFSALLLFAVIYGATLATSHVGFPRYLVPLLPVLIIAAAFVFRSVAAAWPKERVLLAAVVCLVGIEAQNLPRLRAMLHRARTTDAAYASYTVLARMHPGKVFYAGYAPYQELQNTGIPVQQVSEVALSQSSPLAGAGCDALLVLDKANSTPGTVSRLTHDPAMHVLLDASEGQGQIVLQRAGCF